METPIRLTDLAHGGGCGCKLAPAILQQLLAGSPATTLFPDLLVGTETSDDAAIYRLNDSQAIVATTDFFTPIVDDPFDFGRIAATNALSDVYAMGGTPIFALAILGMPIATLPVATVQRILAGGRAVCDEAGIPIAGGHSIDSPEPIYGLVAIGTVAPDRILRNAGARPGDTLILTKPLGIGIFSAALKRNLLTPADYATMLASTTRLNRIGPALAALDGTHACTDVTGFALLGHALEMARGANLVATIELDAVPILPGAAALAQQGLATGAGARNWNSFADAIELPAECPDWRRALLCDPQTSGGLLIAADPAAVPAILALCRDAGLQAAPIGRFDAGPPGVVVTQSDIRSNRIGSVG